MTLLFEGLHGNCDQSAESSCGVVTFPGLTPRESRQLTRLAWIDSQPPPVLDWGWLIDLTALRSCVAHPEHWSAIHWLCQICWWTLTLKTGSLFCPHMTLSRSPSRPCWSTLVECEWPIDCLSEFCEYWVPHVGSQQEAQLQFLSPLWSRGTLIPLFTSCLSFWFSYQTSRPLFNQLKMAACPGTIRIGFRTRPYACCCCWPSSSVSHSLLACCSRGQDFRTECLGSWSWSDYCVFASELILCRENWTLKFDLVSQMCSSAIQPSGTQKLSGLVSSEQRQFCLSSADLPCS